MNPSLRTAAFKRTHLWYPLYIFTGVALLLELTSLDIWLADNIYQYSGNAWVLRDAWFTQSVVHEGGRKLVGIGIIVMLLLFAGSLICRPWYKYRRGLGFLVLSAISAGVLINILKELTHIDCPWDISRYGGTVAYVKNFAPHPGEYPVGACFPAGHASAGWAWFGLYYWCLFNAPRWRYPVLLLVLLTGLLFGICQELRGAHFLSHDVWTLGLSWLLITTICFLYPPHPVTNVKAVNSGLSIKSAEGIVGISDN